MKIRLELTTCARPYTKKELDERARREREATIRFNREMERWNPPSHVEALLIDNKGFTKTFAVPFPPMPYMKMAEMGRMRTRVLADNSIPEMPQMNVVEFERTETMYDPDSGKIKQIVYRERPR